jgi:ribosomal protein L34
MEIESGELRFLRSVAGYTLRHQTRSVDIHSGLQLFSLTVRMEIRKENRHGHILRMTTDTLRKILLNYKPRGYQNIGRPTARWDEVGTG